MANVTLLTTPDTYATVNAEGYDHIWYQFNSTASAEPNFKYVVDLYEKDQFYGTTQDYLGRFTLPPRPITGDGIFSPAKVLKSVIDNSPVDFNVTLQGITAVSASIARYSANYGFQYNPGFTFSTNEVAIFDSFLELTFATPTDVKVGDSIEIIMDNQKFNPQYNGPAIVNFVLPSSGGATGAITNLFYGATPSPPFIETGKITNLIRVTGTSSDLWAWNGTKQYTEQGVNFFNEFVLNGSNVEQFLTDYTNYEFFGPGNPTFSMKPTYLGQYETIGLLSDPADPITGLTIITFDAAGNQLTNNSFGATGMNYPYRKYEIGIGTQNLIDKYGTDFTNCAFYEVFLEGNDSAIRGQILRRIDYDCQYCWYDIYQITWLNRRGSYEYYNFNKDSQRSIQINRVEWKRELPVPYTIGQRGQSVLSQDIEIDYQIQTNWISQYDYAFLEELVSSPEVYVVDENNNRVPIVITDSTYATKTFVRDQLFNLVVKFKYAYKLNIQNQ